MDTVFHFFHNLQTEKALSMRFSTLFTGVAKTLRLLQLCASLLLLCWILSRLSSALQISRLYFHSLAALIASPLFVFFISNAIIATLFANSRRIIGHNSGARNAEMELFREFAKRNADHAELPSEVDTDQSRVAEQIDCQDKQIVSDDTTARTFRDRVEFDTRTDTDSVAELESDCPKVYRRSQSENSTGASRKEVTRNLRRSETEKCREMARHCENPLENLYSHDKLSNEEFQRTIEAFIAKQMRFLREESLAIVVRKQS
ncbi:uncharacterized protein LOC114731577 [Neltuma alba]|uniref:uncharacterized protein LOC114731577 n=1 Tax=Neltuma alba TaxID=207710 RepID=UPI0010A3F5E4|nr:uncharacterized protein LOC114731577 [Prosopis alba]